MSLSLIIFICALIILFLLIGVRWIEFSKRRQIIPEKIRYAGDDKIEEVRLAVFKNAVKIKKLVYREMALLPRRIVKISHIVWSKTKQKIDSFYDKFHR